MLLSIFAYVDRIVKHIVRPQKVLFIAVDGVAPRAKLNQQRSRRFAAAKESARSQGDEDGGFDRNCITPGTAFMARIGDKLRGYIRWKMGQDAAWCRPVQENKSKNTISNCVCSMAWFDGGLSPTGLDYESSTVVQMSQLRLLDGVEGCRTFSRTGTRRR